MRYHNLIFENNYINDLKDEIVNLLTISSSIGINNVKTILLVRDLVGMGYEVNKQTILDILNEIDIVTSADSNIINISTFQSDDEFGDIPDFEQDDGAFGGFEDEEEESFVDDSATEKSLRDITQ